MQSHFHFYTGERVPYATTTLKLSSCNDVSDICHSSAAHNVERHSPIVGCFFPLPQEIGEPIGRGGSSTRDARPKALKNKLAKPHVFSVADRAFRYGICTEARRWLQILNYCSREVDACTCRNIRHQVYTYRRGESQQPPLGRGPVHVNTAPVPKHVEV